MDYDSSAGNENDETLNSGDIGNAVDSKDVGTPSAPVVFLPSNILPNRLLNC